MCYTTFTKENFMELKLADLEKENSQYIRRDIDGGILTEKYEIDRFKLQQYSEVVDNLMLGNYNEFGEYEIQPEIQKELLNCKKVITDNYENILFVESLDKISAFGKLNFAVKVVNSDKTNFKTAILEILEPIYKAKGYIENTQATVIKKITLPQNDVFKSEVYKAFNIVLIEGEGAEKETKTEDNFQNLIDRKIKLLYLKKHIEQQQDFEICYKKNIEELKKTDEGKKIIEKTEKEEKVAEKYLKIEPDDYKSKNEILTKNIESSLKIIPIPILSNLVKLHEKTVNKIQQVKVAMQKQVLNKKKVVVIKKTTREKERLNNIDDVLIH